MTSGYSCESESGGEQVVRVKVVYTTPALNIAADITPAFQHLHGGGGTRLTDIKDCSRGTGVADGASQIEFRL